MTRRPWPLGTQTVQIEPPPDSHCPECARCADVVDHCRKEGLCWPWSDDDDFHPESCSCQCRQCRASRAGVPQCDDDAEHEPCDRHTDEPSDRRG